MEFELDGIKVTGWRAWVISGIWIIPGVMVIGFVASLIGQLIAKLEFALGAIFVFCFIVAAITKIRGR